MKSKLEACLFYQRSAAPSAQIVGANVVFSFTAAKHRGHIMTMCSGTFRNSGSYQSHEVVDKGAAEAEALDNAAVPASGGQEAGSEQPPGSALGVSGPETTLARRSGVEDITQLAAGLSPAECHSLAVFFGLKYIQRAQISTVGATATILAQKRAAAHVFAEAPASEWGRLLTEYSARAMPRQGIKCDCRCGCGVLSRGGRHCFKCHRFCCLRCFPATHCCADKASAALQPYFIRNSFAPDGWEPVCHHCAGAPKYTAIPLQPPSPMDGLLWYFHAPVEKWGTCSPCRWCNPNRDTKLDPILLDIAEVYKTDLLENASRQVRPPGWESAFIVQAVLGGEDGSQETVGINLLAFVMNPAWRAHPVVKYIKDDWLAQPQNHEYRGKVLNPPALSQAPSPRRVAEPKGLVLHPSRRRQPRKRRKKREHSTRTESRSQ